MPLQAKEWVWDLSGKVKIPKYQSVHQCPKCGTRVSDENNNRYDERKEEHKVSKNGYYYITSYDAYALGGIRLTMDEYIEVVCGVCRYAWAEACVDYETPASVLAQIQADKEALEAKLAREETEEMARLEAEARAEERFALMKASNVHIDAGEITHSQWEQESAGSIQPFSMLSPEEQAAREVDALTPVLDTPEETVLPTKRERFWRRIWNIFNLWSYNR